MAIEELIAIIREAAELDVPIAPDTPLISTGLVGSLAMASFVARVAGAYGVTLELDEVGADNFDTPAQMLAVLQRRP